MFLLVLPVACGGALRSVCVCGRSLIAVGVPVNFPVKPFTQISKQTLIVSVYRLLLNKFMEFLFYLFCWM